MKPTIRPEKVATTAVATTAAVALTTARSVTGEAGERLPAQLAVLIDKLPAKDPPTAIAILEQILSRGSDALRQVIVAVGDAFGDPQGVKPKYAVHGLVHHASRPGAEDQRKLVAGALAAELARDHAAELQAFICRQLQCCGRDAEVPALARLLSSDRLCEPAAQALCGIGSSAAVAALRQALPEATGSRRITLVCALGRFGDQAAAAEIRKDLSAADDDLRTAAWYALGQMGDTASAGALLKTLLSESGYRRGQALDACLRLARNRDQAGGEQLCRDLLAKLSDAEQVHDRLAVLAALADVAGVKAVDDLLDALASKSVKLRHHAAWTAVDLARNIQSKHPGEAQRLLEKVLQSTQERAVLDNAQALLTEKHV